MKESQFINQNKKKWTEFEHTISSNDKNPNLISRLFIQITDDLSFSRTFYKNRSVKAYLNGTAQVLFEDIYKSEKLGIKGFLKFWKKDLPVIIYEARFEFLVSLLVLIFALAIGIVSSIQNPEFAREILGDSYVNMTLENIEKGDPMGVYKGFNQFEGFIDITANNLKVDIITFLSGIFWGIGSIISLIRNGVMVGCFQYFFIEKGLFWESFLAIFQHGTLEISTMVISGAAGIALGKGLIFPGTYSRIQAFRISALKGLKIFFGVLPITIMAGFIEGFITRHTETPDFIRILVILFSFSFILVYYVIYPRIVYVKKGLRTKHVPPKYREKKTFDTLKIYNANEILGFAIGGLTKFKGAILKILALFTSIYGLTLASRFFHETMESDNYFYEYFWSDFLELLGFAQNPFLLALSFVLHFMIIGLCFHIIEHVDVKKEKFHILKFFKYLKKNSVSLLLACFIYQGLMFIPSGFVKTITIFLLPIIIFSSFLAIKDGKNYFYGLGKTFAVLKHSMGNLILIQVMVTLITLILGSFILWAVLPQIIRSNELFFDLDWDLRVQVYRFTFAFFSYGLNIVYFSVICLSMGLLYYSSRETSNALSLRKRIQKIGIRKRSLLGN